MTNLFTATGSIIFVYPLLDLEDGAMAECRPPSALCKSRNGEKGEIRIDKTIPSISVAGRYQNDK